MSPLRFHAAADAGSAAFRNRIALLFSGVVCYLILSASPVETSAGHDPDSLAVIACLAASVAVGGACQGVGVVGVLGTGGGRLTVPLVVGEAAVFFGGVSDWIGAGLTGPAYERNGRREGNANTNANLWQRTGIRRAGRVRV